jgi:hypothetical protein
VIERSTDFATPATIARSEDEEKPKNYISAFKLPLEWPEKGPTDQKVRFPHHWEVTSKGVNSVKGIN